MMRYNLSGRTEITQNIIRWDAPKLLERPMLIEITGTAATDPALPEDLEKTVQRDLDHPHGCKSCRSAFQENSRFDRS